MKTVVLSFCLFGHFLSTAQSRFEKFLTPADTLNLSRKSVVYIGESIALGGALIGLGTLWYSNYERSGFHTLNDNADWLQMDKVGHFYSSYHFGRAGAELLKWSGASQKTQLVYGATLGLGFLTAVEILDGHSKAWGFSWGDMAANATGTGVYIFQELLWNEQRIIPKFSFQPSPFASQRPDILGSTFAEQILKDYNGQTYWLSLNLHSFTKNNIPKWLNIAVGYGADGMIYSADKNARRQFYLSLDADLTKIKTRSHLLKTVFSVVNTLKIPAPAFQFSANGICGKWAY